MSKRGSGMRSSLSADDVGSSTKKPGKLSADFLAKFESADSAFGGSTGAIPKRLSHASSSEMGSASASHEHLQSIKPHVKISEPVKTSQDNTGGEDNKNEKKRKSIWKWKPLKKMRRFFNRKKSSRRAKSFEDLRTENYRPKSTGDEDVEKKYSPVVRTRTMPSDTKAPIVKELRQRHGSSSDDLSASSDTFPSVSRSLPVLTSPGNLRDFEYTEEAGISFEDDPNSSSLEGLQAAHDKIKLAPKRRRPPSRKSGSVTSSLSTDSPVHSEQRTSHRRSKTDPKDLTKDRQDISLETSSLSDILNNTIFEEEETTKSPPGTVKEKPADERKAAMDDITSRANEALARAAGRSKITEREAKNSLKKDEMEKTTSTKSETLTGPSKYTEQVEKSNEQPKSESEVKKTPEKDKAEPSSSKFSEREVKMTPKQKDDARRTSLSKPNTPSPKVTSPNESKAKRESKRLSLDENMRKSFTESVIVSKSESDILRAEFTSLLQSETSEKRSLDDEAPDTSNKENSSSNTATQSQSTPAKPPQITPKPFKRGKSWSNNYTPKLIEFPMKQDKEDTKKESINNNASETNSKNNEESTTTYSEKKDFRFSRTKSWSYGMKPGDLKKANADVVNSNSDVVNSKVTTKDAEGSSSDVQEAPSWVAKANRVSQRMSQLIQDDGTSAENQTPTQPKTSDAKDSPTTKPNSPSIPATESPQKPKPLTKKPLPSQDKKTASTQSSLKPLTDQDKKTAPTQSSLKPLTNEDKKTAQTESSLKPSPAPRPKPPSSFVRGSASLPRIVGTKANLETKTSPTKAVPRSEATKKTIEPEKSVQQVARSSFGNVKIEKCIVCGTTVYQMEKCKFDDSVLHRNCIKCSVCKRLLTVGNFVVAESKIYCKPHSRAVVAVST